MPTVCGKPGSQVSEEVDIVQGAVVAVNLWPAALLGFPLLIMYDLIGDAALEGLLLVDRHVVAMLSFGVDLYTASGCAW